MKSKMKSTFAIIAVALMVMVAVVPMVGILTDQSAATEQTITDPASAKDTKIKVEVTVYNASGNADTSGYVKLTYGSNSIIAPDTGSRTGDNALYIYESTVSQLKVAYVDADGNELTEYTPVNLSNLSKGNTYTVQLKAGMATQKVNFEFYAGTGLVSHLTSLSGSYTVYKEATTEAGSTVLNSGTLVVDDDYNAYFQYPAGTTGTVYVVFNISNNLNVTVGSDRQSIALSTSAVTVKVQQTLVTITPSTDFKGTVSVTSFSITGTPTSGSATTNSFTILDAEMSATTNTALAYGIVPTGTTTYTMALSADGSTSEEKDKAYSSNAITYTPSMAVFGTVLMGTYAQAGSFTATIKDGTTATAATIGSLSATVDSAGNYFKYITLSGTNTSGTATELKFTASNSGAVFDKDNGLTITTATWPVTSSDAVTITAATAGYATVSGKLVLSTSTGANISGKDLIVTGAKTFGSLTTDLTASGNNFAFAAEEGKSIIISVNGATLSGDTAMIVGTSTSASKTIIMPTQKVTLKLSDALGANVADGKVYMVDSDGKKVMMKEDGTAEADKGKFTYNGTVEGAEYYYANIRADLVPSQYFVYITGSTNEFAAKNVDTKVAFVEASTYKATTATYILQVLTAVGLPIVGDNTVKLWLADAYKTTSGAIVYNYDDTADAITATATKYPSTAASNNAYSFIASATIMAKAASSITATTSSFVIAVPGTNATGSNMFEPAYVLTSTDGYVSIQAGVDFLKGVLTKLDESTPIAGAKVQLEIDGAAASENSPVTYTQDDGSFWFVTTKAINKDSKVYFTLDGYSFSDSYAAYDDTKKVKIDSYKATGQKYKFEYYDADGTEISTTGITTTMKYDGTNVADLTAALPWKEGKVVDVEMKYTADNKVARTFAAHTLTAEDVSLGFIAFVSEQSEYTIKVTDANGKALKNVVVTVGVQLDNTSYGTAPATIPALAADNTDKKGMTTVLLTDLDSAALYGKNVTGYAVTALTLANYTDSFTCLPVVIESDVTTIAADYASIVYYIVDADGEALVDLEHQTFAAATVYKDGVALPTTYTPAKSADNTYVTLTFVNDPDAEYTVTVPATTNATTANALYSFVEKQEPEAGILYAQEATLNGALMDADGVVIPFTKSVTITPVLKSTATSKANSATLAVNAKSFDIIVNADDVKSYAIAVQDGDAYKDVYTFSDFSTTYMCADESTILFSAVTANGYDIDATFENMQAYDLENKPIAKKVVDGGIIVDADEIVYYEATVTAAGYSFDKKSLLPMFIANETFLTGSVPYSGKGTGSATIELYLEDNLVKEIKDPAKVKIVDKYYYEATLDLSGYIGETAGLVFDSIIVVYYENGVEVGYAAVDPYTAVNNVVSPTVQVYVAVLDAPSALISRHVSIAQVGNTATVSADGQFIVADDDAIYTDGQYIYTFAGWYVDNEKVSSAPSFTFSLTENVVIVPEYTVKYEKISDANAQVDPEIIIEEITKENTGIDTNVLIIGICAVIVALIAVVYAVIKKE